MPREGRTQREFLRHAHALEVAVPAKIRIAQQPRVPEARPLERAVHVGNDDDEGCAASAGRKQRGSFSSLLLLEAHELSTLDGSPNSQRRGAMQAHIEDEFVTRGLEKGAPVASTRVTA